MISYVLLVFAMFCYILARSHVQNFSVFLVPANQEKLESIFLGAGLPYTQGVSYILVLDEESEFHVKIKIRGSKPL